jgi:hypothetical protein
MAMVLPFEVVVKAFSRRLRSEDYGGLLSGVNAHPDDETKVRREHPTQCGTLTLYMPCTPGTASISHVAWEIDRTSADWVSREQTLWGGVHGGMRIALVGTSRLYSRERV